MSRSEPKRLASTLEQENEESCTTYNMLKVSILKEDMLGCFVEDMLFDSITDIICVELDLSCHQWFFLSKRKRKKVFP